MIAVVIKELATLLKNSELPLYTIPIISDMEIWGFIKYNVIFFVKKGMKEHNTPSNILATDAIAEYSIPNPSFAINNQSKTIFSTDTTIFTHMLYFAFPHTRRKLSIANSGIINDNP
ncbi:MAG: hypothetical protein RR263_06090, partial [Oscillospiraceae bacterium]